MISPVEIDNGADFWRALIFFLLLLIGTAALFLCTAAFMLVQYSVTTQLYVYSAVTALLLTAFVLGRWTAKLPRSEDGAKRWRIGPWLTALLLLEIGFGGLVICGHVYALLTHYRQKPGAI